LVEIPYNSLTNFIKPILQDSMKIIPESQEKNEELDFGISNIKEKIEKV
jgi:translation initiation factor 2 gamma subunit (eIF-2gamma)